MDVASRPAALKVDECSKLKAQSRIAIRDTGLKAINEQNEPDDINHLNDHIDFNQPNHLK